MPQIMQQLNKSRHQHGNAVGGRKRTVQVACRKANAAGEVLSWSDDTALGGNWLTLTPS